MNLTEKGKEQTKLISKMLADIRTEFMKAFLNFEEKDIILILDIKYMKQSFMRWVNKK